LEPGEAVKILNGRPEIGPAAPEVAIIIPTFNEARNVAELASRLSAILSGVIHEIIFVDDHSADGTADIVRQLSRQDPRIRIIERIGRRGLSTAVIEGLLSTSAPFGVVIDGDLQHDERAIPSLINALANGADLAVGSRYLEGGGTRDWSLRRKQASSLATRMSLLLPAARISDPMSGFFAVRTDAFRQRADQLVGVGYKILLDLLVTGGPPLKTKEVAYIFRSREQGESKLDTRVALEFAELLLAKTVGRVIPLRFIMFLMVGAVGVGVHFLVLVILFPWQPFSIAQFGATMVAMTTNFFMNNAFTYRDKRLRGWRLLTGWFSFCAASSVGLIANTGVAVYLYSSTATTWYLAALAGILLSATWNYVSTALFTWRS
jgi:dolichol-phosphate mannosyltransferase